MLHIALVEGKPDPRHEILVRVHEPLSIIDLLDVARSTHSWGVGEALTRIREAGCGVVVRRLMSDIGNSLSGEIVRARRRW